MSASVVATCASAELKQSPDSSIRIPATDSKRKGGPTRIRLVRWLSSYKQVFIAELLVRSAARVE